VTLVRLALRLQLVGFVATAAIGGLSAFANGLGFVQIVGDSPTQRIIFATQMEALGKQLSYLLPVPSHLDTLAGYLQWRGFGTLGLVYAFWALITATGAARGDEERGHVEMWLAAGVSRARYIAARVFGFSLAAAASLAVVVVATYAVGQIAKEPIPLAWIVAEALSLFALSLTAYGVGLAAAQLVSTRRGAMGLGGVVLLALYALAAAARVSDPSPLTRLSPFWLHEQNRPLLGTGLDAGATLAMVALAAILIAVSVVGFVRRDLGAALFGARSSTGHRTTLPTRNPLLRLPVLAPLWQQRVWIASWAIGLTVLAAFVVSLAKTMVDAIGSESSVLRVYFDRLGLVGYSSFIGVIWFSILSLILSIYVIAQVAAWSADDAEGRLAVVLSAPISRTRVVLERLAVLLLGCAIVLAIASIVTYVEATAQSIDIDAGRFALWTALILGVVFALAAVGHLVASWRPRVAVIALSAVAVWSYFIQQFGPLFEWPDAVRNLSLYSLYGTPMADVNWGGIAGLVGVGIVGTVSTLRAMQTRDVGA
jgi:ABC-2 type transport system permease protein